MASPFYARYVPPEQPEETPGIAAVEKEEPAREQPATTVKRRKKRQHADADGQQSSGGLDANREEYKHSKVLSKFKRSKQVSDAAAEVEERDNGEPDDVEADTGALHGMVETARVIAIPVHWLMSTVQTSCHCRSPGRPSESRTRPRSQPHPRGYRTRSGSRAGSDAASLTLAWTRRRCSG